MEYVKENAGAGAEYSKQAVTGREFTLKAYESL
jgi:hypothetical protein